METDLLLPPHKREPDQNKCDFASPGSALPLLIIERTLFIPDYKCHTRLSNELIELTVATSSLADDVNPMIEKLRQRTASMSKWECWIDI